MRIQHLLIILILSLTFGCYAEITGTVIDAETGEPIEGAVVLVEWTVTKGFGLTYHEVYKIIEVETDKEGEFTISGTFNPFVDLPDVVIYKAGYVAWRNDFIFPGWKKKTDFKYQDGIVIKLERFRNEYSRKEHIDFIEYGIMGLYKLPITEIPKFRKGINFEKKRKINKNKDNEEVKYDEAIH